MITRDARLKVVAPASALEEDNPLSGAGVAADVVGNGRSIKAYSSIFDSRCELHTYHVICEGGNDNIEDFKLSASDDKKSTEQSKIVSAR